MAIRKRSKNSKGNSEERVATPSLLTFASKVGANAPKYIECNGSATVLSMWSDGRYFGRVIVIGDEITIDGPYKVSKA